MPKKKVARKSQVPTFFNKWLTLMEEAYDNLSSSEFRELEDKIQAEIEFGRKK